MSRYRFELATPADDADLRHVLAHTPMPGTISLTFCREPSFFAAPGVDGFQRQVVACRDTQSGRIVGFGCRSLRRLFVNGAVRTIGYLSTIRLLPEHRNLGLVARGYRFFRDLHADGQTPLYLTTIAEGNDLAASVLTRQRAGLPAYHEVGQYHTIALDVSRRRMDLDSKDVYVRTATVDDLPMIAAFLQDMGPRRQFFPAYEVADFTSPDGALFGLKATDILMAYRNARLVGTLAAWDQHTYRQTIVYAYRGWLGWLRPIYNQWARLSRQPRLPAPGQPLRYLTGALPIVTDDSEHIFAALVQALLREAAARGVEHVAIGLAQGDALLPTLRRFAGTNYVTRIFHVCWPEDDAYRHSLDARPMYLELGSL